MRTPIRVLLASALLLLVAGAAAAHVGPPVEIKLTSEFRPAEAGKTYHGTLTFTLTGDVELTDFRMDGPGWRNGRVEAPAAVLAGKGRAFEVPFTATCDDPDQPLVILFDVNGHTHRKVLDLSPANYERSVTPARSRAVPETEPRPDLEPVPPEFGLASIPEPGLDYGEKAMITVSGRIGYDRYNGDRDYARFMAVEIYDHDSPGPSTLLGSGYTDENGNFSIVADGGLAGDGDTPDIMVIYWTRNLMTYVREPTCDYLYGWASNITYNFTGTELDVGFLEPLDEYEHRIVHLFTTAGRVFTWCLETGGYILGPADVYWPDTHSYFSTGTNDIHMGQDKAWWDGTLAHEFGHFWDDVFSGLESFDYCNSYCDPDPPDDCSHCQWCNESDVIAWMEGWATFFSIACTGSFLDLFGIDAVYHKEAEELDSCLEDGTFHDPEDTEGYCSAVMLDLHDREQDNDPLYPDWFDHFYIDAAEIMKTAELYNPSSPSGFLDAFIERDLGNSVSVWITAANNGYDPDHEPPGVVTSLTSTHPTTGDSADPTPTFFWNQAPDDVSGVDGYGIFVSVNAPGQPSNVVDLSAVPSYTTEPLAPGTYYFNIRAKDRSGKWSPDYASYGPVTIRPTEPSDLTWFKPALFDYPLVPNCQPVNTIAEAHVSGTLYGNSAQTYFTMSGVNQGEQATSSGFRVGVLVDQDWRFGLTWTGPVNADTHYRYANYGPLPVRGGRHTLHVRHDDQDAISESDETNNVWGHQFTWTGLEMSAGDRVTRLFPPFAEVGWSSIVDGSVKWYNVDGLSFQSIPYWSALVMWALDPNDDYDLRLHEGSLGSEDGYATNIGYSAREPGCLDAVVVNRNVVGLRTYDAGILNRHYDTGPYAAELVAETFHDFGDSLTYTMDAGHHLRLFEFPVGLAQTGFVTVTVESEAPVTALWYDKDFGTGPLNGADAAGHWEGGWARMNLTIPEQGYFGLVVYRDPVDGDDAIDFTLEIQGTPPDFLPYWATGWHSPLVPRPAPDGTPALVALPDTLHGNTFETYLNLAVRNESPVGVPEMHGVILVDGEPAVGLPYGTFPGYATSLFNGDQAMSLRGGRHTLSVRLDDQDQYREIFEDNNDYGEQYVWSPLPVEPGPVAIRAVPPARSGGWEDFPSGVALWYNCDGLRFFHESYWTGLAVVGLDPAADVNVRLHRPAEGAQDGFRFNEGLSAWGPGQTDFVLVNYNVADDTPMDAGVLRQGGVNYYESQVASSIFHGLADNGTYGPFAFQDSELLQLHEFAIDPGFYTFRLENVTGAVDWGISLFGHDLPYATKSDALSGDLRWMKGPGENESVTVEITETGYYCLAVWRVGADNLAEAGLYRIRTFTGFTPADDNTDLPQLTRLTGAAPNPFNPMTTVSFDLAKSGPVELNIYNVQGALVRTLVSEQMGPGRHTVTWDGTDRRGQRVSSDVYLVRLVTDEVKEMKKVVLLK